MVPDVFYLYRSDMILFIFVSDVHFFFFFFFQAEDGIRDLTVTGVQTCALPIFAVAVEHRDEPAPGAVLRRARGGHDHVRKDRKSTRLNSSHSQISYAVFCLKKKIIKELSFVMTVIYSRIR